MPTITTSLDDLRNLSRVDLTLENLPRYLELVKGELKRGSTREELRIELQDTNRPDTWCAEGVARQIRMRHGGDARSWRKEYGFMTALGKVDHAIEAHATVVAARPFVQGFIAEGWKVDDEGLKAFIETQETLSRNFGQKRKTVSIGIYDAASIKWPVTYETTDFNDRKYAFKPLVPPGQAETGRWTEAWTPAEILRDHPTGREFKDALEGASRAPILVDAKGEVLSFPPIINSRTLGRVVPGMDRLFVEVTGRNLDQVLLAANILAANMHDRGAKVVPVHTQYGFDTPRGRQVRSPNPLATKRMVEVAIDVYRRMLGEPSLGFEDVRKFLELYGLEAEGVSESIRIEAPPYRMDYLHEVDAVEDFAMSRGYGSFQALMPEEFTVGRLSAITELEDAARDRMIGFGFEEAICNILTSIELVRDKMDPATKLARGLAPFHGGEPVRIANVMNASYGVLRDWLLPSLLEVESHSASAAYPHRVFEAGEVSVFDREAASGSRTERRIGALVAHDHASFSEAQAYLHVLLKYLGVEPEIAGRGGANTYRLEPVDHPSFIPGRAAVAKLGARPLGFLGEVHPAVLEAWGIRVPAAGFEISLVSLKG